MGMERVIRSWHSVFRGEEGTSDLKVVGCKTKNRQLPSRSPYSSVQPLEGDYLSAEYVQEVTRTRSPLKAEGMIGGLKLVQVRRDGNRIRLGPVINFHEGDLRFVVNSDGSITPEPRGTDVSNVIATVLDDHTIRFGYGEFKPTNYFYVKEAGAYLSKAVLVGNYKDEQGRGYEFREDGWAIFPDRKFEFEIGLDHVLEDYDYFMDAGQNKKQFPWRLWVFKWNRGALEIFRTKEVDGIDKIIDSHPFLELRPV